MTGAPAANPVPTDEIVPAAPAIGDNSIASWREMCAAHAKPSNWRGITQILNTAVPFFALIAVMLYGLDNGAWYALGLALPAAALLVRLFMIQHDCGHGSFFKARWANDLIGPVLGVLTLTPYANWRQSHAVHHATNSNLDRRGQGDMTTLTVREYLASSRWKKLLYWLYRHPVVLFGIGPTYMFLLRHRIPTGNPLRHRRTWISMLGNNAALAAIVVLMGFTIGFGPFLLTYGPVFLLAASAGVWLFYVQHQFENTYWETSQHWDYQAAALQGSSHYDLPRILQWVTCHIGLHHIHHLSSRIPNYRLRDCYQQNPAFWNAKRLTLLSSLRCAKLALWDEDQRKMVSFRQMRQRLAAGGAAHS